MANKKPRRGFVHFVAGSGFYGLLAVCLLVIGGVALAVFAGDKLGFGQSETKKTEPTQLGQQVVEPVTNVPDKRTTTRATTTKATVPTTVASEPLFVLPGSNLLVKTFGGNTLMYSETMQDWRCHNGADFGGNEGMTVKVVADGTVKSVEEDTAWGGCVVVDHGFGVQSRYCGVTASVKAGTKLQAGDALGTLSGVPCESADGCHLHLEITVSGAYADPVKTIGKEVRTNEE